MSEVLRVRNIGSARNGRTAWRCARPSSHARVSKGEQLNRGNNQCSTVSKAAGWLALAALPVGFACGGTSDSVDWAGEVEADVDDLTGERTGVFRTFGPTARLVAGPDTVPVTVGYWCSVGDSEGEPLTAIDGVFLKVSLPDTSLTSSSVEAFEELRGTLGLLDVARMAVDGALSAWRYTPKPELGAWYLDGAMGFVPDDQFDTSVERSELAAVLTSSYELQVDLAGRGLSSELYQFMSEETDAQLASMRATWLPAADYVGSHYFDRDTLGVELKGVVKFSLDGFAAAADSVRFWCPIPQSHREWNAARLAFFGRLDSVQTASEDRVTVLQQESARRRAVTRAEQERVRIVQQARRDSIRAQQQARRDSISARRDRRRAQQQAREDRIRAELQARQDSIRVRRDSLGITFVMTLAGVFLDERSAAAFVDWARASGLGPIDSREDFVRACGAGPPGRGMQAACRRLRH